MINSQKKNRRTIVFIFAMTIVPFLVAVLLNAYPNIFGKTTNYGQIMTPPIATETSDFQGFDNFSQNNLPELAGHWLLLTVIPSNHCNAICLESILKVKQLRLMLSRDFSRTRRAVLIFNEVTEQQTQQWWLKDALLARLKQTKNTADETLYSQLLSEENTLDDSLAARLIGKENRETALQSDLIKLKITDALQKKINQTAGGSLQDGMLFLIDPRGNIMMRYAAGFDPYKVKSDLSLLLKASQIG